MQQEAELEVFSVPVKEKGLRGLYDADKADIYRQAAAETGLKVLVEETTETRLVDSDKHKRGDPMIQLISPETDLSLFWKRVADLEAEAAKKAG